MTSNTNERSKKLDWSIFVISTAICVLLLVVAPQWFWVPLPFVLTYLVRGLDMM
jgi:hypothetical protein